MSDQNVASTPVPHQPPGNRPARGSSGLKAAGLIAAGVIVGGSLAATMSAHAATSTPTPAPTSNGSADGSSQGMPDAGSMPNAGGMRGPGGPQPVRSDEKALTGTDLDTAKAAALKAVPGGTVVRAETDAGDATYEVHMTKSGGTVVTVKLDKTFAVTGVETGMGKGDPRMGPPNGQAPGGQAPSGQTPSSSNGA